MIMSCVDRNLSSVSASLYFRGFRTSRGNSYSVAQSDNKLFLHPCSFTWISPLDKSPELDLLAAGLSIGSVMKEAPLRAFSSARKSARIWALGCEGPFCFPGVYDCPRTWF